MQKVKVHVINKLVRKVKKTKTLSEKNPENEKLKRRIDRTTGILDCLKKIKNTEALKNFLTYDKNPVRIIASDKSSNEEIACALLRSNKACSEIVDHIKDVLLLNDDNPGWREQILEPSKKERKVKGNKKASKGKDDSNKTIRSKIRKDSQSQIKKPKESNGVATGDNVERPAEALPEETSNKNIKAKPLQNTNNNKRRIPDGIQERKEVKQRRMRRQDILPVEDPFFITPTGEPYLANIVLKPQKEEEEDWRNNRFEKNSKQRSFNNRKENPAYVRNNARNEKNFREKSNRSEKGLHPSWEARKRNNQIVEFKGKIKTFGNSKQENNTKAAEKSTEKLHPSWAAKQKLKPSISVFQGTKTVFDED